MELTRAQLEFIEKVTPGNVALYRVKGGNVESLYFSDGLPSLNGMTRVEYEQITQKNAADIVLQEDIPGLMEFVSQCVRTSKPMEYYYRVHHKSHGFDWVHANVRLCGTMGGCPVLLVLYANASVESDIYQKIINHTNASIYVIDRHSYEILYANEVARRNRLKELGKDGCFRCFAFLRGKASPCEDCIMNSAPSGQSVSCERFDANHEVWENITGVSINWCGHDAFVQFIMDISKQKELQRKLENSQERFELAVESASMGVWEYHFKTHEITSPSHSFKKFGIPDVVPNVPQSILPMLPPEEQTKLLALFSRMEQGETRVSDDFWMRWNPQLPLRCERTIYTVKKDAQGNPDVAYGIGINVTTEKQAQAHFNESIQSLLTVNPEALCIFHLNLTQNTCIQNLGKSRFIVDTLRADTADEVFAHILSLVKTKEDLEPCFARFNRAQMLACHDAGEEAFTQDYRRLDENGELIWVRTYCNMLRNPATGDLECILYSVDISEEKQKDEVFQLLTEHVYDFIAVIRLQTDRIEAIQVGARMPVRYHELFSFPERACRYTDFVGKDTSAWPDGEDRKRYGDWCSPEHMRALLDRDARVEFTIRFAETADLFRKYQYFYLDKPSGKVLMTEYDDTEQVLMQRREVNLAKAETQRIRDVMDSISTGICVLVMPDPDHLSIRYTNKTMYRMLGFAVEPDQLTEADNQSIRDYFADAFSGVHPDDKQRVRDVCRENFNSAQFVVNRYRLLGAGGTWHWVTQTTIFRETSGGSHVFYATYRDVTGELQLEEKVNEQIKTEQELRKKADVANAAKTEFLSRMSHDMRTPLNGIMGMTRIAFEQKNPLATIDCLVKIDTSSHFMLGLVNDVLDMAKAESNKMELHPEPYDMHRFLTYVDAVIRPLCREKGQHLLVSCHFLPDYVPVVDMLRFNQICFNLLSNATKFTPEGGAINLCVETHLNPDGTYAMDLEISDNGIGMSEEFQQAMFAPFTQENRDDASLYRGSGLGLAIVKKIVDLMGGRIKVDSHIGTGTTFRISLVFDCVPQNAMSKSLSASSSDRYGRLAGKHILLCEDHPLNQEIAKAMLVKKGMIVEVADNGQIGMELFRQSAVGFYHAILMDIRMPVMDGYEATKAIRALERPDAKLVPIIAMTADAFADDKEKCKAAGMNGHVSKPVEPEVLYAALDQDYPQQERA